MSKFISFLVLLLLLLLLPAALPAAVIHVPADQPTIQAGIDAAQDGDTVLVANGVFVGPGNRDITFGGKAIIVRSAGGPEACIIDCQGSAAEGHKGFLLLDGEGPNSVIEGFTIRNGHAPGGATLPEIGGGAIFCRDASPTIRGNVLRNNRAKWYGGGIYCRDADALIDDNTIEGNVAELGTGGGIYGVSHALVVTGNRILGNTGSGIQHSRQGSSPPLVTLSGNTIAGNTGDGIRCDGASYLIRNNLVRDNRGCGIFAGGAGVRIEGNAITGNGGDSDFGGIFCGPAWVSGNLIRGNHAVNYGGGIHATGGSTVIINNVLTENWAIDGGGIYCAGGSGSTLQLINNTIAENVATWNGGAICASWSPAVEVVNCILWGNSAPAGSQIFVGGWASASLSISYSDVEGGLAGCSVDPDSELVWGQGMIDADPLLTIGPLGGFYLSHVHAGQTAYSPCTDGGSGPAADVCFPWDDGTLCLDQTTTRTDQDPDGDQVDMGFHSLIDPDAGMRYLAVGAGPGPANPPRVRKFPPWQGAAHRGQFDAYGTPRFGVNVTCGEVDGDDLDEIITGAGPGEVFGPHVRGFRSDGTPLPGLSFFAYGTHRWGVNVATGDLDGDGFEEIVTGAGPGAVFGPHVRAFDFDGGPAVTPVPGVSFFAYGTHQWGVNVAAGDVDGDGYDEILTGPGPGPESGPHVRGWNVDGAAAAPIPGLSFLAYDTPRYGVVVACGDVDGDGIAEIVTAPGPSPAFSAQVVGWNFDGSFVSELWGFNFLAWPPVDARYGARVWAGTDLDLDGRTEIVVGGGPGPWIGSTVRVFSYRGYQGFRIAELFSLGAFPPAYTHGVNVAAGRF